VLPVIKHIPGHGRAFADSHHAPARSGRAPAGAEARVDFTPFRAALGHADGMTAHVVYTAVDRKRPGTTSRKVIREVIRRHRLRRPADD
jgi:beta-N-acetylhexosaminidase